MVIPSVDISKGAATDDIESLVSPSQQHLYAAKQDVGRNALDVTSLRCDAMHQAALPWIQNPIEVAASRRLAMEDVPRLDHRICSVMKKREKIDS